MIQPTTAPITRAMRDSNMELLRIVAMFMIVVMHFDFFYLEVPTRDFMQQHAASGVMRVLVESLCIPSLNAFVLISGWYGMKLRGSKIVSLVFQCVFFLLVSCGVVLVVKPDVFNEISIGTLLDDYWFVRAYIVLCLFVPALNLLVEHASQQMLRRLLIALFLFQMVFGWDVEGWIARGYSPLSFMALYLWGRYVRIYRPAWSQRSCWVDLCVFLSMALLNTVLAVVMIRRGLGVWFMFSYIWPVVMVAAMALVLFFSKLSLRNRLINWMAASCIAVYLLHCNVFMTPCLKQLVTGWYNGCGTLSFVTRAGMLVLVIFVVAIVLDKLRLSLWNKLAAIFSHR